MVKISSIGEPKVYLGSNFGRLLYGDGSYDWTMRSDSYIKEAIDNMKKRLKEDGMEYNRNISDVNYFPKNPLSSVDYMPEFDASMECNEDQVSLY